MYTCLQCVGIFLLLEVYDIEIFQTGMRDFLNTHSFYIHVHSVLVVEREKKKKLPANRVGAKFDHQQSTDQAWLPSFGRVWSKGGRQQSK